MKRQIITIDEDRCTGCGLCIPNCPEGALQIIDGKARLVSDLFCDGLGACIGHCPEGAITTETREAEPYDESKVMENIAKLGPNVINGAPRPPPRPRRRRVLPRGARVPRGKRLEFPGSFSSFGAARRRARSKRRLPAARDRASGI